MKKRLNIGKIALDCHCEEGKARRGNPPSDCHKWIAALPLVARNDSKRAAFTAARGFSGSQINAGRNAARGFTLAEVLITLTIIGVIAAITIPNLMQKWKKHERITQIKAAYAITQNIVKSAVAENGDTYTWDYNGVADYAQKYVIPHIKYQYLCGSSYTAESGKKCFNNGLWNWLNGSPANSGDAYGSGMYYKIKLQNGMDLGIWASPKVNGEFNASYGNLAIFLFDVDGASRGTTTTGEDIFAFKVDNATGKIETFCNNNQQCNDSIENMLSNTNNYACNKDANGYQGLSCARVIERNGWEFPENYPIKKF